MAQVRAVSVKEQNSNLIGGAQFDTSVYSTAAGQAVYRMGRDGPVITLAGTHTAVTLQVVLENANAAHGDMMIIKRGTQGNSTSVINLVTSAFGGAVINQLGSSAIGQMVATFDGSAFVWR